MLLIGHMGYTVGAAWAIESAARKEIAVDYRAIALMAIAPDIIDRVIFVFILPAALEGRLIAHTLVFQLAFVLALTLFRRGWWFYGIASLSHLLLDTTRLSTDWAKHLLWPLLGSEWRAVNILPGSGDITVPYNTWVWQRIQTASQPYGSGVWWVWALDIGGALILAAFAYRNALYRWPRLREFLTSGIIPGISRA
ncbi:MAG: metal-dependent hydrolase [Chloroflexi bacterium]|nr:metal-dependent hydrolase [Chloroflexota bacterium]